MNTVTIEYNSSVYVQAGWRSVTIIALAELNKTGKMCSVVEVLEIDGCTPRGFNSRTGAKRQTYNATSVASGEIGKNKRISSCVVL